MGLSAEAPVPQPLAPSASAPHEFLNNKTILHAEGRLDSAEMHARMASRPASSLDE